MRSANVAPVAAALAATIGLAVAAWAVSVSQMRSMDMGIMASRAPFAAFMAMWVAMMAAMMLPGAVPQVLRLARTGHRVTSVIWFLASYLSVWVVCGVAAYGFSGPHTTTAAGAVTLVAGLYEFTPLKREFRRRCCARLHSGFGFGVNCVGATAGLMAMQLALGMASLTWMIAITAIVALQKLVHPRPAIDVPVGLAIIGLGILVTVAPAAVPGSMPAMAM